MTAVLRAAAWVMAELARVVVYAGLVVAVVLTVLGETRAAAFVAGGWLLTVVLVHLSERLFWNSRRASRALVPAALWIVMPAVGSLLGTVLLLLKLLVRVGIVIALPVGTVVAIDSGNPWVALGTVVIWFGTLAWLSSAAIRDRVIVDDFEYVSLGEKDAAPAKVDVADLLRGELSRLATLLHVVGDRRAVSSGITDQTALDATLSVDELSNAFRGAAAEQATITVGKATIPLGPVVRSVGRVVATARITGRLHQDGQTLILTAHTTGARRIAWRVDANKNGGDASSRSAAIFDDLASDLLVDTDGARSDAGASPGAPVVAQMVRELSLRIYTDLALDQSVRWEACEYFVAGLRAFRSCLRTPKDRKVNLRAAEGKVLEALAEDEDFPLAYYNLGVVYTELYGLAKAAGRKQEARMRQSAAETSFGRAIDKDPRRWDCHFAFAQTQLSYGRRDVVIELGRFMLRRTQLSREQEAKTRELIARASTRAIGTVRGDEQRGEAAVAERLTHLGADNPTRRVTQGFREARRASEQALSALVLARARRTTLSSSSNDHCKRAAELAAACLLTYARCYLTRELVRHGDAGRRIRFRARVRMRHLIWSISRLSDMRAELQHTYGSAAMYVEDLHTAEAQLREAAGSVPTRPGYSADLALCRVLALEAEKADSGFAAVRPVTRRERDQIVSSARRAIQAMTGTFFPAQDLDACASVAAVYTKLGLLGSGPTDPAGGGLTETEAKERRAADVMTAMALHALRRRIRVALHSRSATGSTANVFLLSLLDADLDTVRPLIGAYGTSARSAFELLCQGQREKDHAELAPAGASGTTGSRPGVALLERALLQAEGAVSLNPLSTFAWETRGDIFAELSDFENARDAWKQALRTDPDNPNLYAKIGQSHWNIANQGGARHEASELRSAVGYFRAALLLYGNDDRQKRILTHGRLAKLYSELGRLADARRHLRIVDAASSLPPLVGWVTFALACLRREEFSEAEYYFNLVIKRGTALRGQPEQREMPIGPESIVGDRLDESLWPWALILAWAHVGLVLSWIDRDARAKDHDAELVRAEDLLVELYGGLPEHPAEHERFPTRLNATIAEARGRLAVMSDGSGSAIPQFEHAISEYPYSRTYAALADALDRQLTGETEAEVERRRAERLAEFAGSLGPADFLPAETQRVQRRFHRDVPVVVASENGSSG